MFSPPLWPVDLSQNVVAFPYRDTLRCDGGCGMVWTPLAQQYAHQRACIPDPVSRLGLPSHRGTERAHKQDLSDNHRSDASACGDVRDLRRDHSSAWYNVQSPHT